MRLLYVYCDGTRSTGVSRKITTNIASLNAVGLETDGLILSKRPSVEFEQSEFVEAVSLKKEKALRLFSRWPLRRFGTIYSMWSLQEIRYRFLREFLERKPYDAVMFRYPLGSYSLRKFVQSAREAVLFEHNTKELDELNLKGISSYGARAHYRAEKLHGREIRRRARGLIAVTPEIAEYQKQRAGRSSLPVVAITNGIDVDSLPIRTAPPFDGKNLSLLMLCGSPVPWHGEDRLLRGMAAYSGPINIRLRLVGRFMESTQQLVNQLRLTNQVEFVAPTHGDDLNCLFDSCHLAVAPLAVNRKGLRQATPLKVREYLARGIAFVYAYDDPDLADEGCHREYCCKLEMSDHPLSVGDLVDLAKRVCNDREHPLRMRSIARQVVDSQDKARQLQRFIEAIV